MIPDECKTHANNTCQRRRFQLILGKMLSDGLEQQELDWVRTSVNEEFANNLLDCSPMVYEKLSAGKSRLLRFVDGPGIQCVLYEADLETTEYVALSYVWGDTEPSRHIVCNGSLLRVTPNLYDCLGHMRNSKNVYWVDAICINQEDPDEKSAEVKKMVQIYKNAVYTNIWMGECWEGFHLARRAIQQLSRSTPPISQADCITFVDEEQDEDEFEPGSRPHAGSNELREFGVLFHHAWFMRAWTFQEVVHSPVSFFIWETNSVSFFQLYRACTSAEALGLRPETGQDAYLMFLHAGMLYEQKNLKKRLGNPTSSLLNILSMRRNVGATDDRDRIYAHVGTSNERTLDGVQPNYRQTVEEVYIDAAVAFVSQKLSRFNFEDFEDSTSSSSDSDSLTDSRESEGMSANYGSDTLCPTSGESRFPPVPSLTAEIRALPESKLSGEFWFVNSSNIDFLSEAFGLGAKGTLPSWVPDWRLPGRHMKTLRNEDGSLRYLTTGGRRSIAKVKENNRRILGNFGFRFDRVASLSSPYLPRGDTDSRSDVLSYLKIAMEGEEWDQVAHLAATDGMYKYTGEDIRDALFAVQVTGFTPDTENFDQTSLNRFWPAWTAHARMIDDILNDPPRALHSLLRENREAEKIREKTSMISSYCTNHRLMVTERGFLGLVPKETEVFDELCFLAGGCVPYILRPSSEGGSFQFVGDCYVHGLMYGEAVLLKAHDTVMRNVYNPVQRKAVNSLCQPTSHLWPEDIRARYGDVLFDEFENSEDEYLSNEDTADDPCPWNPIWIR